MDAVRRTQPKAARRARNGGELRLTERARSGIHAEALAFIRERYDLSDEQSETLAAIPVRWRRGTGASAYYPRRAHGFDGPHILLRVPRGARAQWHTYTRARARFGTPPGGIELDTRTLAAAVLVHELTHAVQHGATGSARRRFSEVETTGNEIEFVRRHAPDAFALLVPVLRRPRRRAKPAARVAPSGLAALRAIVLRTAAALGLVMQATAPAPPPPKRRQRGRLPRPTGS